MGMGAERRESASVSFVLDAKERQLATSLPLLLHLFPSLDESKKRRLYTHLNLVKPVHHRNLNVLGSRLHDLQQGLDGELDGLVSREIVSVVLLEELSDRFRGASDGVGLQVSE